MMSSPFNVGIFFIDEENLLIEYWFHWKFYMKLK